MVSWSIKKEEPASIERACRVTGLTRSLWYYRSCRDDTEVIDKLAQLAEKYARKGIDTYFKPIRREGIHWGRNRVLRGVPTDETVAEKEGKSGYPRGLKYRCRQRKG